MGKLKQLHLDCVRCEPCLAPKYASTCYNGGTASEPDTEPTEPPENTDGGDRDPSLDMEQE